MSPERTLKSSFERLVRVPKMPNWLLFVAGFVIVSPLWVTLRPPIQDLPQHVAAVRVLASYFEPAYRFQEYFTLVLSRTQYLTVYLLAVPLAKVLGPTYATKAVLSMALIGTPFSILRLLRALKFDPWLACLSLPFVFNIHVAYGFLNFVAAIPLLFLGLALAVEQQQAPSLRGQLGLSGVLLLCFFTHVVPFGLLAIAVLILTRWERRAMLRQLIVMLPAAIGSLYWLVTSPAGRVVASFGRSADREILPATHLPFGMALRVLPDWLIYITNSESENLRIIVWLVAAIVLLVLSIALPTALERSIGHARSSEESLTLARIVVLMMVPLSWVAYFALPNGYGFIWPICQRFPVLAILLGLPLLGRAPRWALRVAALLSLGLATLAAKEQARLFRDGSAEAYFGFDEVIANIPYGSRVATLVFERQIEGMKLAPLMHSAGWVQTERGGIVMFSFAEFPSSPFTYRANRRPPPVPPRWEWGPDRVVPDRDLGWYDYCLVQGWSGSLELSRRFNEVWRRGRWSLWRRVGVADPYP